MRTALRLVLVAALLGASGWYYAAQSRPAVLVLTGIVTTNDVVVAPQIGGRIAALHVKEGDAVTAGQLLAEIEPGELAGGSRLLHAQRREAGVGGARAARPPAAAAAAAAGSGDAGRGGHWHRGGIPAPPPWPTPSAPS